MRQSVPVGTRVKLLQIHLSVLCAAVQETLSLTATHLVGPAVPLLPTEAFIGPLATEVHQKPHDCGHTEPAERFMHCLPCGRK